MGYNVTKDEDNGQLDELVEMIDKLIASGDGHLTVSVEEGENGMKVKRYSSTDCTGEKSACCQPTETATDEMEDE
ncbi:MAG: hypothetical protein IJ645_08880 [Ruminococcus sp.]|nr:hypothetical protein [Ruminococcus sp.]